jgi:hypothetical protein
MATLSEAIADAQLNYKPGTRRNMYTGDVDEIKISAAAGNCTCRGACGSHTGPCTMKAAKGGTLKMCKACSMSASKKVSAGGPGSGKKPTGTKLGNKGISKPSAKMNNSPADWRRRNLIKYGPKAGMHK